MIIVPVKEGESIDRALKRYKRKYENANSSPSPPSSSVHS